MDFFSSVTDNVCKKRFFVPSVIGKTHSFNSLDVAAGGREFFSVRNRERVQKTNFLPSVTDNVCKNEFSSLTCAKIGISRAGVDVRTRGTKIRALDGRVSPRFFFRVAVVCYPRRSGQINFVPEAENCEREFFFRP